MKITIDIQPNHFLITIDGAAKHQIVAFGVEDGNGVIEWNASTYGNVPRDELITQCSQLVASITDAVTVEDQHAKR